MAEAMSQHEENEADSEPDEETGTQQALSGKKNPNFAAGMEIADPGSANGPRKFLLPLFLVYTLSVTYIVLVYVALPLVINVVTTRKRIAMGEIDSHVNEVLATSI